MTSLLLDVLCDYQSVYSHDVMEFGVFCTQLHGQLGHC